jgi:hypothetical protein
MINRKRHGSEEARTTKSQTTTTPHVSCFLSLAMKASTSSSAPRRLGKKITINATLSRHADLVTSTTLLRPSATSSPSSASRHRLNLLSPAFRTFGIVGQRRSFATTETRLEQQLGEPESLLKDRLEPSAPLSTDLGGREARRRRKERKIEERKERLTRHGNNFPPGTIVSFTAYVSLCSLARSLTSQLRCDAELISAYAIRSGIPLLPQLSESSSTPSSLNQRSSSAFSACPARSSTHPLNPSSMPSPPHHPSSLPRLFLSADPKMSSAYRMSLMRKVAAREEPEVERSCTSGSWSTT